MIALTAFLRCAFILYSKYGDSDPKLGGRLVDEIGLLFEMYVQLLAEPGKNQREIVNWSPCVVMVWTHIMTLPWHTRSDINGPGVSVESQVDITIFKRHIPGLYQLAVQMVTSDRSDIRSAVQKFLVVVGEQFLVVG